MHWVILFHIIKVVKECIGKYLNGSDAHTIWVENSILGGKCGTINACHGGTHYTRPLKRVLLFGKYIERLQWCDVFNDKGVEGHSREMQHLRDH